MGEKTNLSRIAGRKLSLALGSYLLELFLDLLVGPPNVVDVISLAFSLNLLDRVLLSRRQRDSYDDTAHGDSAVPFVSFLRGVIIREITLSLNQIV